MKKCPKCQKEYRKREEDCFDCHCKLEDIGHSDQEDKTEREIRHEVGKESEQVKIIKGNTCPHCGEEIEGGTRVTFCSSCGKKVELFAKSKVGEKYAAVSGYSLKSPDVRQFKQQTKDGEEIIQEVGVCEKCKSNMYRKTVSGFQGKLTAGKVIAILIATTLIFTVHLIPVAIIILAVVYIQNTQVWLCSKCKNKVIIPKSLQKKDGSENPGCGYIIAVIILVIIATLFTIVIPYLRELGRSYGSSSFY